MSTTLETEPTPYEQFLRQNLEEERRRLDELNREYSSARGLRKFFLKRELDSINQNIQILTADLRIYENIGISWLREPTKKRDEKAEHLKPVPAEALGVKKQETSATPSQARVPPKVSPTVGVRPPVAGTPSPTVGRPIIGQPRPAQVVSGTPQASQNSEKAQGASPQVGAQRELVSAISKPVVASPNQENSVTTQQPQQQPKVVTRPRIGTPIGTPPPQKAAQTQTEQKTTTETGAESSQSSSTTSKKSNDQSSDAQNQQGGGSGTNTQ